MFQRLSILKKRPDLSQDAFSHYWRNVHAPLLGAVPGLKQYRQNHIIDRAQRVSHQRRTDEIDGFAQLWFEDEATMQKASQTDAFQRAFDDLQNFVAQITVFSCEENHVVIPPSGHIGAKRMSLLYGKPDMSLGEFRHHWLDDHADMVARFPDIRGYSQHLITGRIDLDANNMQDTGIDCQGILEMTYDTVEMMDAAFESPEAKRTIEHGSLFLSGVNTYLVEEVSIL